MKRWLWPFAVMLQNLTPQCLLSAQAFLCCFACHLYAALCLAYDTVFGVLMVLQDFGVFPAHSPAHGAHLLDSDAHAAPTVSPDLIFAASGAQTSCVSRTSPADLMSQMRDTCTINLQLSYQISVFSSAWCTGLKCCHVLCSQKALLLASIC